MRKTNCVARNKPALFRHSRLYLSKMVITSVNDVLERPFKSFTIEEQLEIVRKGRFTDLREFCQNDKGKYRNFSVNWYQRVKWLTGNILNRKLYCWNCVLFPSGVSKNWNSTGFDDLKNLSQSIKKHEESRQHIYSTIKLKLFSKHNRSEEKKEEAAEGNLRVKRNREYMERLIDIASALGHYEIPFSKDGDDGFYRHILNIFKKYDDIVRTHLEDCSPFKGLTRTVQVDLLHAIAHTIQQKIVTEVSEANFFALMVTAVNCSRKSRQMAVSVRYVKAAKPVERFIGFYDIGPSSKEVVDILEKQLEKFNYKEKMISQSFDGGVVKSTDLYNLQRYIKDLQGSQSKCQFIHCYSYEFSEILAQSLTKIQECKLFFSMVNMFTRFFKQSSLKHVLKDIDTSSMATMQSCIASLKENYKSILVVLEHIITTDEFESNSELISSTINLISHLKSYKFMAFVTIFQCIFAVVSSSIDDLKTNYWNTERCRKITNDLQTQLRDMKNESVFNNFLIGIPNASIETSYFLYLQIIDHVVYEIEGRFLDIELSEFCSLVSLYCIPKTAAESNWEPDNALISSIKENYFQYFDVPKLQTELFLLYRDPTIVGIGDAEINSASDMLLFMEQNEIICCLPMLTKFLELVITPPSLSEPLKDNDSVSRRIRKYCETERNDEPRNAFATFVIEKDIFYELEKTREWYNLIIDYFATLPSTANIELIYNIGHNRPEKIEVIAEPELSIKSEPEIF